VGWGAFSWKAGQYKHSKQEELPHFGPPEATSLTQRKLAL
jgi:hypothetical protein